MQKGKKTEWTDERIEILRKFYQVEPNDKVAERLGISSRTLVRKAKELQLYKPQAVTKSVGIEETVRNLYHDHSLTEIGEMTHTSWRTIQRIAKSQGLTRSKEEDSQLRSRIRQKLIDRERARITWGLDQRTNIKLVCNHPRIRLRTKLKGLGYIVLRGEKTIYYPPELKRHLIREENGRKLGLDFAPWSLPAVINKNSLLSA